MSPVLPREREDSPGAVLPLSASILCSERVAEKQRIQLAVTQQNRQ